MKKQIIISFILLSSVLTIKAQTRVPDDGVSPIWYNNESVGIGTSPSFRFHIRGGNPNSEKMTLGTNTTGNFALTSSDGGAYGLFAGVSYTGRAWLQAGRYDENIAYDIVLQASGGNVGIGTSTPNAKLHIIDPNLVTDFMGSHTQGVKIETEYPVNHFSLLGFGGWSQDYPRNLAQIGAKITDAGSYLYFGTSNNYASGITNSALVIDYNGNIGIGTTSHGHKLDVCGTIRAKEILVDLNGSCAPDYVFNMDYKLMDLKQIEKFVKSNKHLPDIPSEKEMVENGVNMKDLQLKLLQKIEELTLYVIEQNKNLDRQNEKIAILESEIKKLKTNITNP